MDYLGANNSYLDQPDRRYHSYDGDSPSYFVEHLATFAVGRQYGLQTAADGLRKLKHLKKTSAIWAQPLILRLKPDMISIEDENGDVVERYPMELVADPTANLSNDPRDVYNNLLLFIVKEDTRRGRGVQQSEMHIFQCNRISAQDIVEDIKAFIMGQYQHVRTGRRDTGFTLNQVPTYQYRYSPPSMAERGYRSDRYDDASASSDSTESFEKEVNTLNRCFDDIERFVQRIQSSAMAQKELDQQAQRYRTAQRGKRGSNPPPIVESGILQMRAQMPNEYEFFEILQKFKLSFNLLAKLKNHIHEPNAPELLHFLFAPLMIILDACEWRLGRKIAPQVLSPLISREARELMQNCLTSKESDVWMSLGDAWRVPPEDWIGSLPKPYHPIFMDGFAPYGPPVMTEAPLPPQAYNNRYAMTPQPQPNPMHRGGSAPLLQNNTYRHQPPIRDRSVDNLNIDFDRMNLEKERLDFEREKIAERERRLIEEERRLQHERQRLAAEKELMSHEAEQKIGPTYGTRSTVQDTSMGQMYSPNVNSDVDLPSLGPIKLPEQSPRQKAFLNDIISRRAKLAQATFDRVAQNAKELTISRGEYLEVLNDSKNWWECTNMHHRVGYVPRTILAVINPDSYMSPVPHSQQEFEERNGGIPSTANNQLPLHQVPAPAGMMGEDTPDYIKQRQGKRGEFRYF